MKFLQRAKLEIIMYNLKKQKDLSAYKNDKLKRETGANL